jgi:hypothetical protein
MVLLVVMMLRAECTHRAATRRAPESESVHVVTPMHGPRTADLATRLGLPPLALALRSARREVGQRRAQFDVALRKLGATFGLAGELKTRRSGTALAEHAARRSVGPA